MPPVSSARERDSVCVRERKRARERARARARERERERERVEVQGASSLGFGVYGLGVRVEGWCGRAAIERGCRGAAAPAGFLDLYLDDRSKMFC
jgi:hypothetical protein